MSFMHFMTSSYIQLPERDAYVVARAFQVEERPGLRSRLQRNMDQNDFMIDIICFEQNVAHATRTGRDWDEFADRY